jgi:uncharacterized membrane protein
MNDTAFEPHDHEPRRMSEPPVAAEEGDREVGPARAPASLRRRRPVAVGLGLFSVGLGLAKLVAARALARLTGVAGGSLRLGLVRGTGVRELGAGVGLLAGRRATPWLWARVAGDAIDLALLGATLRGRREGRGRVLGAMGAVAGVAAVDVVAAVAATGDDRARAAGPVRRSVTIARPREEVYRFWRDFENAPSFMSAVESVEIVDGRHSRWSARGPAGPVVNWDAVVVEDLPNERIAWRSIESARSDVRTSGVVRFATAPGDRGTEVHLELRYGPSRAPERSATSFLWKAGAAAQIEADLGRCKQLLETGHVTRSDASLHGGTRAARPEAAPTFDDGDAS